MLFAISLLAGWAATSSPINFQNDDLIKHQVVGLQNPSRLNIQNDAPSTPLHVIAECIKGCPVSENKTFIEKSFDDPVATFTALLFLATFALFIYTALLWRTTKQTLQHTRKSSEEQLRAYLFAKGEIPVPKGSDLECVFRVENSGQTPAYKLYTVSASWIDNYPVPITDKELGIDDTPICIGPRDHFSLLENVEWESDDVLEIVAEKKAVYVKMHANFEDAFGHPRTLKIEGYMTGSRIFDPSNEDRRIILTKCAAD